MANYFSVITICGSMRYYARMLEMAQSLTGMGYIVLMPFVQKGQGSTDIEMLDRMHKVKIDMSFAIMVVGEHRGASTLSEIEYARQAGIPVYQYICVNSALHPNLDHPHLY